MRVSTPIPYDPGNSVHLKLSYREDAVQLEGTVRWCRQTEGERPDEPLPGYDIGIAFTRVGAVDTEGIWRTLTKYVEDSDDHQLFSESGPSDPR